MMLQMIDLWRRQAVLAGGFAAMGPFAGFVVATRLTQMAVEGGSPTASGARETQRMVSEKMSAAFEGGVAASRILSKVATAKGPVAAAGLMVAAGEAAMRPADRTVRANARRLAKRR
jgi:hypothetical protein